MRTPFRIAGHVWDAAELVVAELADGAARGRGEACGVYYRDDTAAGILARLQALRPLLADGLDRIALQEALPAGGARNALDCAFWELEAQRAGVPVWRLAGLARPPRPLLTTYTLGADAPATMAAGAHGFAQARALKLKLTGDGQDGERVRAVRAARPEVWLGVDANQGFTADTLEALVPVLVEAGVALLEQPFPIGQEAAMEGLDLPLRTAADESVCTLDELELAVGRFDIVNIKLDKCGGLTHALAMAERARALGLGLMVGNMTGTSWAQAPAYLVGQSCEVVDLDGPLLLAGDRTPAAVYADGRIHCAAAVWGSP
ncbi:MAG: dipeptide epimerase [Pseudoxanthomonas sp.]